MVMNGGETIMKHEKRVMIERETAGGIKYAVFRKRRGFDFQRFIDGAMSVVLVGWMFVLTWYAASTVIPALIR